ncbi:tissue inhibitor of metalloproteinase [Chelonus insularis]|uniref:tissue inhibitor of metalloproteinase n=1 Tax=Chelonus insularis TaxID=460826 RepID=UPI00158C8D7B|nr:tissue inhibitor of metalloproteinase [Chelonus insularis]XP_034940961.1 tissue inhibitor of metalloproteinase [Chelonus insularis]XP_034940972.1 tissue inhibitor of metalloproteinase [Chelonus insularis]
MWRFIFWPVLLILGLSTFQIHVEACSCASQHPQTHYCEADFVVVVRIKKFSEMNDHESAYKVKIHKIFKATSKAEVALEEQLLWTASMGSMCGRENMKPGETWVVTGQISGGKPRISLCNLAMRWSEVTARQRKGFRGLYHRGCVCQIVYTPWLRKGAVFKTAGKRCLWESAPGPFDCQEQYGVCMLRSTGCLWELSPAYKRCIIQHQRLREQQRAREP